MEFIARTVTHPNPRLTKEAAIESLKKHPEFKQGTVIVKLEQKDGHWTASLHEPKTAGPPPFLDDEANSESAPTDEVKPDEPMDEAPSEDAPSDSDGDDKKDKSDKKPSIESVMELVEQIAKAVGVPTGGEGGPEGPEGMGKEPMDDPLPPPGMDGPPGPPPGAPKPGLGGPKETIHRKAPLGVTPIGAPAYASTKVAAPKVASFEVEEPWDGTVKEAMDAINAQYGPHGYQVRKIKEAEVNGTRVIRARVSVR